MRLDRFVDVAVVSGRALVCRVSRAICPEREQCQYESQQISHSAGIRLFQPPHIPRVEGTLLLTKAKKAQETIEQC